MDQGVQVERESMLAAFLRPWLLRIGSLAGRVCDRRLFRLGEFAGDGEQIGSGRGGISEDHQKVKNPQVLPASRIFLRGTDKPLFEFDTLSRIVDNGFAWALSSGPSAIA